MAPIIIPVLLCFFLGPGIGQLYNKEYKKGIILIVISFLVLIAAGMWYFKALQPYLPSDLPSTDPQAMQELVRNAAAQVSQKQGYILSASEAVLMVLWLYGIVDAFNGAKKRMTTNGRV